MNKQRLNKINSLITEIEYVKNKLESIKNEEENYYDNIPENLQSSDRANDSEEYIDIMYEAIEMFDNIIDKLGDII